MSILEIVSREKCIVRFNFKDLDLKPGLFICLEGEDLTRKYFHGSIINISTTVDKTKEKVSPFGRISVLRKEIHQQHQIKFLGYIA